jgi:SAM-dependent methyltransferase
VLEHVSSPTAYLAEARRLCKPDGLLILSTHGYWQYHPDPTDYWRWTSDGLIKLLKDQGWRPIELIGILGFAAAAMSLMQDALASGIPERLQAIYGACMQQAVGFLDYWYKSEDRQENAAVFLLVAVRDANAY